MCACVRVCVCARARVCVYVRVCVGACLCACVNVCLHECVYVCVSMCVCVWVCACMRACVGECIYASAPIMCAYSRLIIQAGAERIGLCIQVLAIGISYIESMNRLARCLTMTIDLRAGKKLAQSERLNGNVMCLNELLCWIRKHVDMTPQTARWKQIS